MEYKQGYVPDIRREVIAFANAEGGTMLVGVRNNGEIAEIADPESVMLQVLNSLKDAIAPDVMPFISVRSVEVEGKLKAQGRGKLSRYVSR